MSAFADQQLLDLTRRLIEPVGFRELVREIADTAVERLDADRGTVFVYADDTDELWAEIDDPNQPGDPAATREIRFPATAGLAGEALQTQTTIVVPDVTADPRFNADVDKSTGYRTRTLLTVPITSSDGQRLGVVQLLNKSSGPFDDADARSAEFFVALVAVAWQRSLLERDRESKHLLERELDVAREIQEGMWPDRLDAPEGYELAGWCQPATKAGGDSYDVARAPDGSLWLLLADATGHGVGPALAVAQVRSGFRMAARAGMALEDAMAHMNDQALEDMPSGRFVTAALARLDPVAHTVDFLSAGHGPNYHATPGQPPVDIDSTGPGLGMPIPLPHDPPARITLAPGDSFVLFTDGLFEALNPAGTKMELEPVEAALRQPLDARAMLDRLRADMFDHADGHPLEDDVTLLVLRRA